jgi:hypothetical protein
MDNSLHSSCFVSSFSNTLRHYGIPIDDDLLFGLSCSFDFQYGYVKLPASGYTHTFSGINFKTFIKLAYVFNMKYLVDCVDEKDFLNKLKEVISSYETAIVEVSIKEYMEIYDSQQELDDLMSMVMESNTNHTINVVGMDDTFIHIYDNFRFSLQQIKIDLFMKAVFPKQEAVIPSRGRIHYFDIEDIKNEITSEKLLNSIRVTMQNFLYSTDEFSGMRGLDQFHTYFETMLMEQDPIKRERSFRMFHFFCVSAGGGSFFRRNYSRFLKKINKHFNDTEIAQAYKEYKNLHQVWRKFSEMVFSCLEKESQESLAIYEKLKETLALIVSQEKEVAMLLHQFSEIGQLKHIDYQAKKPIHELSLTSIVKYLEENQLDYQFKSTNLISDIEDDYNRYNNIEDVFVIDSDKDQLVTYDEWKQGDHFPVQTYFYFIVHKLEVKNNAIKQCRQ